jgi:DNA (cytosine-5)-methyltransferase 1
MRELHLFAGIGGGLLAGRMLGHTPVVAVEKNEFCRAVLADRFPDVELHEDVKLFDGTPYRGKIDVVCGGFPCQPFSCAGKMLTTEDPRHLWPEMARIIKEVQPRYVFAENVSLDAFREPYRDLRDLGYQVPEALCLGAVDVGLPHRRNRWWLLAHADGEGRQLERPSGSEQQPRHDADRLRAYVSQPRSPRPPEWPGAQGQRAHAAAVRSGWWPAQSHLGRTADGFPGRVDRVRALGNAQVPSVAATAWRILWELNFSRTSGAC